VFCDYTILTRALHRKRKIQCGHECLMRREEHKKLAREGERKKEKKKTI
jgi:hypothetical protein